MNLSLFFPYDSMIVCMFSSKPTEKDVACHDFRIRLSCYLLYCNNKLGLDIHGFLTQLEKFVEDERGKEI